ncbi:MAG: pyridoxamine 5'-phosphate oxidase family protein [Rhodobiaceae bacterium]|nr:pyridoxamine 5'-phosphate oxidase family protein [Rhodobiaceae bacterium]MCC0017898.1 pyridoxamine 5'-phosphate oxidase family protein [Rhodobiaceae bacterium]MCC0051547.1 pyridoxamine 5'-phosphate oxidase family protein [Rhodobiaceae bacterium]MCC0062150.1 pyridoxamine 5'-phosphate oxidase family protein [Rhodobiaceae bacterium]
MNASSPSDIAFTDAVKQVQSAKGSREAIQRMTQRRPWTSRLTPEIVAFVEQRNSAFLGTANRAGQPYIQHRGGPAGFLHVLDERMIGFADLAGNRQFITLGNLSENPAAFLFLIDYATRVRVKFWGKARVVEDDCDLIEHLQPQTRARAERAILFEVAALDINCPSHIPMMVDARVAADAIAQRDARIAELEAALAKSTAPTSRTPRGGTAPRDRYR